MADCIDCGKKIKFLNKSTKAGVCFDCMAARNRLKQAENRAMEVELQKREQEQKLAALKADEQVKLEIDAVLVTTETVTNLKITERLDVITSQAAFEINNFKDIVVGFMNPVNGRANEMEKQIDLLKDKAMYDLKSKAHQLKANGVVGVDLDISTVTIGQISMLMLVASGTAVLFQD